MHYRITKRKHLIRYSIGSVGTLGVMSSPAYTPAQLLADLLTAKSQSANAAAESIAALGLGSYSSAQSAMVRIGQGVVPRSNTLGPLEAYFGVDRSAFTSNAAAHSAAVKLGLRGSNVAPAPAYKNDKKYPLISPVQAGMWTTIYDNFQPGDADEWLVSTKNLGNNGYMLRVRGDSMTAPGEKHSFRDGVILHVNPDIEAIPGKFVIVRREAESDATFKKLTLVDGELYLEAINPIWPNRYIKLQPGDTFCGVVVDASFGDLP